MDTQAIKPVLSVQPDNLDFAQINPKILVDIPPQTIMIKNSGGGVLAGDIIPQVEWINVVPSSFKLLSSEHSQHTVRVLLAPPQYWTKKFHHFDQILLVTSNAGQQTIPGQYFVINNRDLLPILSRKKIWISLMAFLLMTFLFGGSALFLKIQATRENTLSRPMILTIGAETIHAGLTESPYPTNTIYLNLTQLFESTEQLLPTNPSQETTPPPMVTFTPWPRDRFPSAENLLFSYYGFINNRDYVQAWSMLSEYFHQNCCNEGLIQPFEIYKAWWEKVQRVEIVSGQVIQPDQNPLEIRIRLKYFLKDGGVAEDEYIYGIISDALTNRLLINEVGPVQP